MMCKDCAFSQILCHKYFIICGKIDFLTVDVQLGAISATMHEFAWNLVVCKRNECKLICQNCVKIEQKLADIQEKRISAIF